MIGTTAALIGAAALGAGTGIAVNNQNKKATQGAPDYNAQLLAGIQNDASTLPFRLQINQAAATGGTFTDPNTGKVYDFRGNFDANRFFATNPAAKKQYDEENQAAGATRDPQSFAHDWLINNGKGEGAINDYHTGSQAYRNQTDIDSAKQMATAGSQISDQSARAQLQSYLDLLPQFNQLNNAQQQATIDQMLAASQRYTQNTIDQNLGTADYASYVRKNPDLLKAFQESGQGDIAAWGKKHYDEFGKSEGRDLGYTGGALQQFNKASLEAQRQAWDASLDAAKKGTYAAFDWQKDLLPQLNALGLGEQRKAYDASQAASQTAFRGNLDQADMAGRRASSLQQELLPGLNDLGLRLQSDAYRAGDATGRQVNGGLYGIRDQYAANLLDEMKSGSDLTAAQKTKVQQRIRGAQASRGNILGDGAAFDEAIAESDYAQDMIDKRRSAALGLLNSRDLNPNFGAMSPLNPTQVVAPNLQPANFSAAGAVNPLMPNFSATGIMQPTVPNFSSTTAQMPNLSPSPINMSNPLAMLNPNAGSNAASYGLSAWNSQQNRVANAPNPWMQGLGAAFKGYAAFGGS